MLSVQEIDSALETLFREIRFCEKPAGLYDPLRYMIAIGGKRIRPRLVLTTYSLFQDRLGPDILEPAAALEVFHSFTLIHDDIMDASPLRRGQATVWKKWSPDTAILSGDVMCIDSYRRMAQAPASVLPEVLHLFSQTAAEVCDGQQYDMDFEKESSISMERYIEMIGLKTAVLIACAAKLGALIAGAPAPVCEALYRYGYDLGLAFQVADDYLDAYGDAAVFGKPIGGDILNNKKSWLTVRSLEKGAPALPDALAMPAQTEAEKECKIQTVKAIYGALGIPGEARQEISRLSEQALQHAAEAVGAHSPGYQRLYDFATALIGRSR